MDIDIARIIIFRRFQLTSANMLMPALTTIPNITMTPPPSTDIGIAATTAPTFGMSPQATRNKAPSVTTDRLITPVIDIKPTFWLKDVFGRPPNKPATKLPTPSA